MKVPAGTEVERREFDSDISQRLAMFRNYESRVLPLFQVKHKINALATPTSVHAEVMSILSKVSKVAAPRTSEEGRGGGGGGCVRLLFLIYYSHLFHATLLNPRFCSKFLSTEGSAAASEEAQKGLCAICLDKVATHICSPCGHRCGCADCLAKVRIFSMT